MADQGPLAVGHGPMSIDDSRWTGIPWVERPKTPSGKTTGGPVVGRRMPPRDTWESSRLAHVENHPIQ